MLHPETLEMYRRMTPGERLKLTLEMTRSNGPAMYFGESSMVERRFKLVRRQNEERNLCALTTLARTKDTHG